MAFPLVHEIAYQDPCQVFSHFEARAGSLFLDSAEQREHCGRYSFIALDPFQTLTSKNGLLQLRGEIFPGNPFEILEKELKKFPQETFPELPPFQGGVAGYFGYELAQHLEDLPLAPLDAMHFPDLILGFYDVVLAFDERQKRAWIFSTGFPAQQEEERLHRARERLENISKELSAIAVMKEEESEQNEELDIFSNFSPEAYQAIVGKTIDYILAGDIFEANLSQQFYGLLPQSLSPFQLYKRLRKINPAPFAAYLNFSSTRLVSASPERFLKLNAGFVETRPIKGTVARGKTAPEDKKLAQQLLASEKDRAENVMIVDLLRNDLSRVCDDYSVQVPKLCALESYATVHHLVSVVTGRLKKNLSAVDLIKASFPGGSVTGAPKCRAMEIIALLEPTQRGPYCGSIAYLGFDGAMDSSITIRTFCIQNNKISFQAGGAVVADSSPKQEYDEVLLKARALFKALGCEYDFAY